MSKIIVPEPQMSSSALILGINDEDRDMFARRRDDIGESHPDEEEKFFD